MPLVPRKVDSDPRRLPSSHHPYVHIPLAQATLGDIALAVEGEFEKYLAATMNVLQQAGSVGLPASADEDDREWIAALHQACGAVT